VLGHTANAKAESETSGAERLAKEAEPLNMALLFYGAVSLTLLYVI
jgi:hypothetical protein